MVPFVTLLVVFLLQPTTVTLNPLEECLEIINNNGANVYNCSGKDLNKLRSQLPNTAEILDFSRNKFTELPLIPEIKECPTDDRCAPRNFTYHCRQDISFSRNQISNFSYKAIMDLQCLRTLDLSHNNIKDNILQGKTFMGGVFHLQRLLLNNNPLGSLPDSVINEPYMPHLRELDLSHCDLEKIGRSALDDFAELEILNLSFNKLKELHGQTFMGLRRLEQLDLRENQLTFFSALTFGDQEALKVLLLSDNKIQGFSEEAFYRDSNLQVLDLRNNRLNQIPYTALGKLAKLQTLDLSQNPIQQVRGGVTFSNVQNLILDNMPDLTELGPNALSSFPALVSLSISGNKRLQKIHRKFLGDSTSLLKRVTIENNNLHTLSSDALPWKQLEVLRVVGNPWYCDVELDWMIKSPGIQSEAKCAEPPHLKGHHIKALDPDDLMRDYSLQSATAIIVLAVCLPIFGVCGILIWRRRRYCPCVKVQVQGQYVNLFTRDLDEEGQQKVVVHLKNNANKLKAVSNGSADDSIPFIKLQNKFDKIDEEHDKENI